MQLATEGLYKKVKLVTILGNIWLKNFFKFMLTCKFIQA
jgi:hypothetical protein